MGRIVIACYRPKAGEAEALKGLLKTHHSRLLEQGLVTERRPIVMEAVDGSMLEVFEWASKEAIAAAHTHPEVARMWAEFGEVCDYVAPKEVAETGELFAEFSPMAD